MTDKTFTRDELRTHYGLPYEPHNGAEVILDELVDLTRWSAVHRLVFRLPGMEDGEAWQTSYRKGATEMQEERPWEFDDEIGCTLVVQREVTALQWVAAE